MAKHLPVVRTRLIAPRLHRRILHRPRLDALFSGAIDYRLTILQAGAGYGKTTALAALPGCGFPLAWYHLTSEDSDPYVFLLHLVTSFKLALPAMRSDLLDFLESGVEDFPGWPALADELSNHLAEATGEPMLVVLDDAHILAEADGVLGLLDRLIGRSPADVHFIISSRYPVRLPSMVSWRARGEVLFIGQEELAFTTEEIASLFRERYSLAISDPEIQLLADQTEGWAIALQLYWQGLKSGAVSATGRRAGTEASLENLFDYLAQEVFDQLSPDVRQFLWVTAVLRELNTDLCNGLRGEVNSDQFLRYLLENGLFLVDLGGESVRHHPLFREFILQRMPEDEKRVLHRRAARCFVERKEGEQAIYHLLKAGDFLQTAGILVQLGEDLVRAGRLETLNKWIGSLPPDVLENYPLLMVYLGDVARLRSRFDEALGWYHHAEERSRTLGEMRSVSQALHGQARVYLDTVNPSQAEQLLQEALRIADGTEDRENRARLLELLAENRLNSGRLDEAERYREQARSLRELGPGEMELSVRVLLRTGKLEQARRLLEQRMEEEHRSPVLRPRAHRETPLLLSLILAFQGEGERAFSYAIEGTERGRFLDSPFITAVGLMRQGHAWLLRGDAASYTEACRCYQQAIDQAEHLAVPRLKVEAMWGFCRAHGFRGTVELAEKFAVEGLEKGRNAGDEWISALILVSMGGGYALAGRFAQALDSFDRARAQFVKVSDAFGESVSRLWQCLVWWKTGDALRLERSLEDTLRLIGENGFEFLLTRPTLIGPPDPHALFPLLIQARSSEKSRLLAERMLEQFGVAGIEQHPGYQLRVHLLGQFSVWRGSEEVAASEWRREKARQLFQMLLTYRHLPLERERIVEMLSPGCDPATGVRNFKVAMSTLFRVLDPGHSRDAPSAYIEREGSVYSLRHNADLWLDSDEFERLVTEGDRLPTQDQERKIELYRQGLRLYKGDYLPESIYEDWSTEERERLQSLYLRTANLLAHLLAECGRWSEVIELGQSILGRDACWEEAYRLMMKAYIEMGNRAQALRTYQRCVDKLQSELGAKPSTATIALGEALFPFAKSGTSQL